MFRSLVCAFAICLATASTADADVLASSPDAGVWDNGTPLSSTISIAVNEIITDAIVSVSMSHGWVGDVTATLTHVQSGFVIDLVPTALDDNSNLGFDLGGNNLIPGLYVFSDTGTQTIGTAAGLGDGSFEIPLGTYLASDGTATGAGSLATVYGGDSTLGDWRLDLDDAFAGGSTGILSGWSLFFFSAPAQVPEPGSLAILGLVGLGILARRRR